MNPFIRIIAWSVCAALPVTIGCDDKSETAIDENLQVEPVVCLKTFLNTSFTAATK